MKKYLAACCVVVCLGISMLVQGCRTTPSSTTPSPARPAQSTNVEPPKVRFSEFKNVELKHVTLAPMFASHSANQRARDKIDQELFAQMRVVFPGLKEAAASGTPAPGVRTLVIEPVIADIKFIGGKARFFAGALAGSSRIRMTVTYRDTGSGEIIAEPQFYAHANAFAGAYSIGGADNAMLSRVVQNTVTYSSAGR